MQTLDPVQSWHCSLEVALLVPSVLGSQTDLVAEAQFLWHAAFSLWGVQSKPQALQSECYMLEGSLQALVLDF
jgi:hypothetical protein